MDVQAVSTAIAKTLEAQGFHSYDYGPDAPISPAAFVYPDPFPYHADYDGDVNASFVVRFLIQSTATRNGQLALNALISPTGSGSAVAMIEADSTLGGVIDGITVQQMRGYGVVNLIDGGTRYYTAELVCEVLA